MKVSINWLQELVKSSVSVEEIIHQIDSKTIGVREITPEFFELDMKGYNRADLLSLRGVALEVAAITDSEVNFKDIEESEYIWNTQKLPPTPVKVEAVKKCPFYCIAKIESLKVKESPATWVKRLNDSGVRSVNNVADVTNLVMLEYGQPTHAFDADKIRDETLIVRMANTGEGIVSLDNKKRVLEPVDIVITDPEKAVGIAGVMGGKNSEVDEGTSTILLEAAIFDPASIRKTANRLSLPSEASKRFQHGLTRKRLLQAVDAAIKMYQDLGGKLTALTFIDNFQDQEKEINVLKSRLNSLIGLEIAPEFVQTALEKLHFQVKKAEDGWQVVPPFFRLDVSIEADVIEEVVRMYGYENIPAKELKGEPPEEIDQSLFEFIKKLKLSLVKQGLDELQTYSFYSTKTMKAIDIYQGSLIKLANPMSAETEYLRSLLWPNLVEKVADNLKAFPKVGVFEVGKVYQIVENNPTEKYHLGAAFSGKTNNPLATIHSAFKGALADLKVELETEEGQATHFQRTFCHPTRVVTLRCQNQEIGYLSEIHPKVASKIGTGKRVAILELDLSTIL